MPKNIPINIEPGEKDEPADKKPATEPLLRRSSKQQAASSRYPPDEMTTS